MTLQRQRGECSVMLWLPFKNGEKSKDLLYNYKVFRESAGDFTGPRRGQRRDDLRRRSRQGNMQVVSEFVNLPSYTHHTSPVCCPVPPRLPQATNTHTRRRSSPILLTPSQADRTLVACLFLKQHRKVVGRGRCLSRGIRLSAV